MFHRRGRAFAVAAVLSVALAGCGGAGSSPPKGGSAPQSNPGGSQGETVTLDFTYWASAGGEEQAFNDLIAAFEQAHPGIKINKQQVPPPSSGQYYTTIQNRIAGNTPPDIFRVQYQQIGTFAGPGALLDLSPYLPPDLKDQFLPAFRMAAGPEGKIVAVPHHTDTLAIFYNKDYLEQIGVKAPEKLDEAWTHEQFLQVAAKLKERGLAKFPVAINWSATSAYRWLPYLYQYGGALLTPDLKRAAINSPEGVAALRWTLNLYKQYMSPGNSLKGTDKYNDLFASGVAGMLVTGDWMIPYFEKNMTKYRWGVTYMPVGKGAASDMGGNALAVPKNAKHPKEAAQFVAFALSREQNKDFLQKGYFLPVRKDLKASDLTYSPRPEEMKKFVDQVATLPDSLAQTMVHPQFAKMNQALADALEAMLVQGVSPEDTARNLEQKINAILGAQ